MEKGVKEKMSITETSSITPQNLTNIRPLTAALREFFAYSQLSQFMDQTNPLSEVSNKRRISALGPGGLNKDRARHRRNWRIFWRSFMPWQKPPAAVKIS